MKSKDNTQKVFEVLERLDITYVRHQHPPVFTVEQAEQHWKNITGAHCKNLFLRNKKGNRHYLVILEASKQADLRTLAQKLGEDRLSFASPERLMRFLGLEAGSVSPFGLINDSQKQVKVIVDSVLKEVDLVNFHPNINTETVGITYSDFEKFLAWIGHNVSYVHF
jgi:Ala-tRNA(Pro) deacylase